MNNATRNIFILTVILALFSVGAYVYVTKYVSSLIQKTSSTKEDIDMLEIRYNHLESLHKAAMNTSDEKNKISSYIVRSGGSVDFITNLEKVASLRGLKYSTDRIEVKSATELEANQKELLEVLFTVTGNWSSVFQFVKLIELMPNGLKIQRLDFTSLADTKAEAAKAVQTIEVGASSSTPVKKLSQNRENMWKATILFSVVKIKDN